MVPAVRVHCANYAQWAVSVFVCVVQHGLASRRDVDPLAFDP